MNLPVIPSIKSVTDLRYRASKVFKALQKKGVPVYITKNNKPIGVLLSPEAFKRLWERYEDWRDQMMIDEVVASASQKDWLDFLDFDKKQRKKLGLS